MSRSSLVVFTLALTVRLLHVWQIRTAPFFTVLMGDSRAYDDWAQRIASGDWIGRDVFYQAPLYPYFLGVIYSIAGRHLVLVRIVQAVLGSVACVCVALAGRNFFCDRAGLAAGVILALYAPAIFFDGLIQKSVLDVFFVSLALWLMSVVAVRVKAEGPSSPVRLKADTTGDPARMKTAGIAGRVRLRPGLLWLLIGLAIGGLTLTRENAIVLTVVIAVWAFVTARLKAVAAFLAGVAIVLLPVAVRNSVAGGGFYVTTSQFGPNFYIGNNSRADGTYQSIRFGRGAPEYERNDATRLAEEAAGRRLTPAEVSGYWTDQALDFIAGHPGEWLRLMARKLALLVNATEMLDTESQESYAEWSAPLRIAATIGHFGVLVPLAVLGMFAAWRTRSRSWILLVMLAAYGASVVMFYVFARYRYPLVPMLVLYAGAGLVAVSRIRLRSKPTRTSFGVDAPTTGGSGVTAIAAVLAAAVFTNWPILSKDMMRAITEHNLGAALQEAGRHDDAAAHYRRALAIAPDYAPAYNNLATALRATGRLREAVANYQQALRLRPDYPEAHYNLANALLDEGKPDEAVAHFERALKGISGSADVHNNLGIALSGEGRFTDAVAEFRAALRLEPDSARAHRNLGDALATLGVHDESIEHLRRAAALDPSNAALHYDLGSALLEAGRADEAIAEFRATLTLTPNAVEAHNNLGVALGSRGELDDAIAEFRRALQLNPAFTDAQRNLSMALAARKAK